MELTQPDKDYILHIVEDNNKGIGLLIGGIMVFQNALHCIWVVVIAVCPLLLCWYHCIWVVVMALCPHFYAGIITYGLLLWLYVRTIMLTVSYKRCHAYYQIYKLAI